MEALDKIFIPPQGSISSKVWVEQALDKDYIEYIRKDALLEWAKDMKEANDGVCDTSYYQEFIDKINSM